MNGHNPTAERQDLHLLKAAVGHRLGKLFRVQKASDRLTEVGVGLPVARDDPADGRHEIPQIHLVEEAYDPSRSGQF